MPAYFTLIGLVPGVELSTECAGGYNSCHAAKHVGHKKSIQPQLVGSKNSQPPMAVLRLLLLFIGAYKSCTAQCIDVEKL